MAETAMDKNRKANREQAIKIIHESKEFQNRIRYQELLTNL